jgi:arsenate reductase
MQAVKIYGLKNCDTCKRARKELDAAKIAYEFHDLRDEGVSERQISRWAKKASWEKMLNKSSTTWRALPDADRTGLTEAKAVALMPANPALIKRPLITRGDTDVFVGWTKDVADAVKG